MVEEFNLSDVIGYYPEGTATISIEHIKEAVRLLKERVMDFDHLCINVGTLKELVNDIDKIFGDKLVEKSK